MKNQSENWTAVGQWFQRWVRALAKVNVAVQSVRPAGTCPALAGFDVYTDRGIYKIRGCHGIYDGVQSMYISKGLDAWYTTDPDHPFQKEYESIIDGI